MSRIPQAVIDAEEKADDAIAADAASFNPSLVGTQEEADGISVSEDAAPSNQNAGLRMADVGHSARQDDVRVDASSEHQEEDRKIEITQKELSQKIESGKNEIRGLFESRLKNLSQVSDENKNLRRRVEELEKELSARANNGKPDIDKLRSENPELAHMDDDEIVMVSSLVSRVVAKELGRAIPDAANSIRSEIADGRKAEAMRSFASQMEKRYPGLTELDSNNDPAWLAFLDSPVPGTGGRVKYGSPAKDALDSMDVQGLSEIVEEFARQSGHTFGSRGGVDPRVASQVRARQSSAGNARQSQQKPVFTRSQVDKFNKDYASGSILRQLSPKAVAELRADIESAEDEGRIVDG